MLPLEVAVFSERANPSPIPPPPSLDPSPFPSTHQVRQGWKTEQKLKQPAWEEFLAVCRVLRRYNALHDVPVGEDAKPGVKKDEDVMFEGGDVSEIEAALEGGERGRIRKTEPKPTSFGRMLGAINAENELWMALVLTRCDSTLST